MTAPFIRIAGQLAVGLRLHVPGAGAWWAEVDLAEAPDLSGRVTIEVGSLSLSGTIDPGHSGTFGLQRRVRVVAGGGGWGSLLRPRAYHNDASIRARTLAEDAAREAGEELGSTFLPSAEFVGIDYVRQAGPASRALEDVIGSASWWLDYEGRTQVGSRSEVEAASGSYEVLEFDPRTKVVTLALDDLTAVGVGSVLSERLDEPVTVRELLVEVGETLTVTAYCGGTSTSRGRLLDAFTSLVTRTTDAKLFGVYRFRVVQMSGERVELQAVSRAAGLPDVLPVSMWPGVAGAHAEPAGGSIVLVEFVEGDRRLPIVRSFSGKDSSGWSPTALTLDASGASASLKLGANATKPPAWAPEVRTELTKIALALSSATAPSGGGTVTYGPNTYTAPTDDSAIGAAKTRCE